MQPRETVSFDTGWKFRLASASLLEPYEYWLNAGGFRQGVPGRAFDDSTWREVNLPHDFVIEGGFVQHEPREVNTGDLYAMRGSRPAGVGWYRKRFTLLESDLGRRVYLYFDGVFRDCRVYLNEYYVGSHPSGYSSFYFDVTDLLEYGGENLLVVRADATRPEGWFYEGGGIYRHVWLVKTAPLHVAPHGTFITSKIDFSGLWPNALLDIRTEVANQSPTVNNCQLISTVFGPDGQPAGECVSELFVPAWGTLECQQQVNIEDAKLWSLEQPNLYRVVTTLRDGEVFDIYETTTGIRSLRFDPQQGFFLNEKPVKIQGVCCHQDHAGVGSAFPDRLHEFRLERLKAMGCNAYRCSHHPPAPELLDAADRLGLLVMDEKRRMSSADEDLADLESIIRRDRNHPSLILWSIGNEEVLIQWTPQAARIARRLKDLVHRLDPSRPVTLAICFWNPAKGGEEELPRIPTPAAELDVMGFNYAVDHWEGYHALHPTQPMIISEASTNFRTRGCYQSDDEVCHLSWDDPRAEHRAELQWAKVAQYPYLSGTFLWTGFDYHGEPSPSAGWPAVSSQFGLMDLCGFPKDNYYYFRAAWRPEPLVHLFPHWNWPDRVGLPVKVGCYTNCDEVELFLNGRSLGRQTVTPNAHLEWPEVIYELGTLEAKGYRSGALIATDCVETTGAPHAVRLLPDRLRIQANRMDGCVVDVEVIDEQGRVVPDANHRVTFKVNGPGKIIGVGNGDPGSHEPEQANHRRAFNGRCQAILQPTGDPGSLTLTASAPGLLPAFTAIEVAARSI